MITNDDVAQREFEESLEPHRKEARGRSVSDLVLELYASSKVTAMTLIKIEKRQDDTNGNFEELKVAFDAKVLEGTTRDAKVEGALFMIRGIMALALFVSTVVGAVIAANQAGWIG